MARDYWFAFGSRPAANTGLAPSFITFVNGSGVTIAPPTIAETYVGSGLYKVNYNATQTISFVMDGATTGLSDSIRYIMGVFDPNDTFGSTLVAIGNTSIAIGTSGIALGNTAIAIGTSGIALGNTAIAIGNSNIALGMTNVAIGLTGIGVGLATGSTLVAQGSTIVAMGDTLVSINLNLASIGSTASLFGDSITQPGTLFGYMKRVVEFLEGDQTYTKASGVLVYEARGGNTLIASKTITDSNVETTRS